MRKLTTTATRAPLLLGLVCLAAVVIIDQWSKAIVVRELGPNSAREVVTIIPGLLRLIWVKNTGSAFGLFQGGSDILKYLALGAVVLLVAYFIRIARSDWLVSVALGLMLGGAIGNLIDRFRRGYVVDWIDFPRFPTFNAADSAITVGVTLLMFSLLFRHQPEHSGSMPDPSIQGGTERAES